MLNIMGKIMFDFWGTLAYLEQGEDFGQVIANSLKISKKEYAQLVLDNWFINNISSEEFAKLLVKKSNIDPVPILNSPTVSDETVLSTFFANIFSILHKIVAIKTINSPLPKVSFRFPK